MKKFCVNLCAIFFTGLLLFASVSSAQEYKLRYKLEKGTKFSISSSSSVEEIVEQMGNEMVTTIKSNSENNCEMSTH